VLKYFVHSKDFASIAGKVNSFFIDVGLLLQSPLLKRVILDFVFTF
jgi:hypothetical protein